MKQTFLKAFLLFFITINLTGCDEDSINQTKLNNIEQIKKEFSLEFFNDNNLKKNLTVDWSSFNKRKIEENEIISYEFDMVYNGSNVLKKGKNSLFFKYKLYAAKNDLGDWDINIIKFNTQYESLLFNLSSYNLSSFSGTLIYYNLNGEIITIYGFEKGNLVSKTVDANQDTKNLFSKRDEEYYGCTDCYVTVTVYVETWVDWYSNTSGGTTLYYTGYSVYQGTSVEYETIYIPPSGSNYNPSTYHQHINYSGSPSPPSNHDSETLVYEEDDMQVFESPDTPITNMADYLDCFDSSQEAVLTIYVDQPRANSDTPFATIGDKAGHAFIGIFQNGISRVWGLYPEDSATPWSANDPHSFGNDQGHEFDVSISLTINSSSLENILNDATSYSLNYDLNVNNCTDYVLGIAQLSNLTLPDPQSAWTNGGGSNPGAFGEALRDMVLPQGVTRNSEGGNAPQNSANCN